MISDRSSRNSSWERALCTLVVIRSFEQHAGNATFARFHHNFEEEHRWRGWGWGARKIVIEYQVPNIESFEKHWSLECEAPAYLSFSSLDCQSKLRDTSTIVLVFLRNTMLICIQSKWTVVLDESRSFFRVHTGYFSNIRSLRLRGLSPEFGLLKENSKKRTKIPTEQEAKPAVATPSLQQWRSPSTFRGVPGEDPLKWLKEYDRVVNFNKGDDMMKVKILGHLVSSNGVHADPDKAKAVRNFPTPKNIHDIRSFLGLRSYLRRFIKGFCHLAEHLQSLLKSGVEFHWGPEEVEAFNSLEKALTSDPVLGTKPLLHKSILMQVAEKNYSTTERECLGIVWATNKFRPYIFGKHFTVVTDHHFLCWFTSLKDPSGRLARWALRLQEHDFDVKYKTGKKHLDADALSRNPVEEETETPDKF
ncbi:retrovirus-related Pol polyprotein from transposon 17.6 [Trichonephila clavipes]|uniref:RNA-directed DNA polymerase n=1 Tax=Trichonephila clavipes TaxID=2585209 RepID=A0A8X6R5B2_TRICX|nr:retrovirus-related Pol polyprotein from transposon 17.6 [Trichonephila clavipes]